MTHGGPVGHAAARSGSTVLEFGFKLDCLVYTYIVNRICTQFRLAPEFPDRYLVRHPGSVFNPFIDP
jgi:hypothetical protein